VGKASSQKKVARAATTGGGRTAGVKRPIGWYSVMAVVAALGVFLVGFSRHQELSRNQAATKVAPRMGIDHWHSAFSVYLCDHWAPNIPLFENKDNAGLHTHGDGVIHVHPYIPSSSGSNATLGYFVNAVSKDGGHGPFKLTPTELQFPGDKRVWRNGDICQGKPGKVKFTVNGKEQSGDPRTWKLRDGDLLNVGFVPADMPLPSNPAEKKNLANITDVTTPTGTTTPGSTAKPGSTATTAPAAGTAPATSPPTSTR